MQYEIEEDAEERKTEWDMYNKKKQSMGNT